MDPRPITTPAQFEAAGAIPKVIAEYVGHVADGNEDVSIARMHSPAGWSEPGQRPEFDEYTLVLDGVLEVEHDAGAFQVKAGQAAHSPAGAWVRYSTPNGADYVAVCRPAFSPATVHRDDETAGHGAQP